MASLAQETAARISRLKFAVVLYLTSVLLIYGVVSWNARDLVRKGYPDFTIYYSAAVMVRRGLGPHLYEEAAQFKVQREFAPGVIIRAGALPYNHPPFEALIFAPLSYLPYLWAFVLWDLANLGMLIALPYMLRPYLPGLGKSPPSLWILASLAFFPAFLTLLQGQDAILLLFLYALVFVFLKKQRFVAAGACLACGLFKFHLVLPFLILLLVRERRKVLWGFLLVTGALSLISIAVVGMQPIIHYPHYVLHLEETMARGAIMPADMPNLRGVLYLISPHIPKAVVLIISVAVFLLGVWYSRGEDRSNLKFALGIFVAILVSYHALGYDLSLLLLAVPLLANDLLGEKQRADWSAMLIVGSILLLFLSPLLLVLLMRYESLALAGWAVLFGACGILGQLWHGKQQRA